MLITSCQSTNYQLLITALALIAYSVKPMLVLAFSPPPSVGMNENRKKYYNTINSDRGKNVRARSENGIIKVSRGRCTGACF